MLYYYLNLFDGKMEPAWAVMKTAQNQFEQFEQYLRNSITSLEKKEITASWEKVETANLAELRIAGFLYEFSKQTVIRIIGNQRGYYRIKLLKGAPNYEKKIEYKIGDKEGEAAITEDDFQKGVVFLGIEERRFDALRWGFAEIDLRPVWCAPQSGEMLRDSKGVEYKISAINADQITIAGSLPSDEELFYGDAAISFNIEKEAAPPKNVDIKIDDKYTAVFYSRSGIPESPEIKPINYRVKEFIDFENIYFDGDSQNRLQFTRKANTQESTIVLKNNADYGKTVVSNNILFEIKETQSNNMDSWKIQLKETSTLDDVDDEQDVRSPLRYFFDENVTIRDANKNNKNEYYVERKGSDPDEYQIILCRNLTGEERKQHKSKYCFPPEGSTLKVQVDTRPLKRQLEAVSILKQMPHKNHEMLLRLFENKERARWSRPQNSAALDSWFVLRDESRSGCVEQRRFIHQALNTPDFAILEGPPGSGKTTAILELICQLVKLGKRVLLCGSTNVAIDNILERIIEKKEGGQSLLEQIDILPVRIGRTERIGQTIAAYQIDNLIEEDTPEEQREHKQRLLLDAANLVCGTTMGIINHPKFKERGGGVYGLTYTGDTPVIPEFDVLIIDESSKTTFQEFLIPALYAKRWILAGDVMQLSPFTDRENIECNFEHMALKNDDRKYEPLDINIQQAVFYLDKIEKNYLFWRDKEHNSQGNNHFALPVSSEVLEKMAGELAAGRLGRFTHNEIFVFITKDGLEIILEATEDNQKETWQNERVLLRTIDNINFLEMAAADMIIFDKSLRDAVMQKLPATHALLQTPDWETMPHAFYHAFQQKGKFGYFSRGKRLTDSFEIVEAINEELNKRNWPQEIAWRIDSEHQLRQTNSTRKDKLKKEIDRLTPFSVDKSCFEESRDLIAAMSLPSILESLAVGIKGKKPRTPSTISEGFSDEDLRDRKTTLTYQHRMHPEISAFPRECFYKASNALLDLESPKPILQTRQWDWQLYDKRSVWVHVESPTKGSRNIYEVEAMMEHLKKFLDYAVSHPQPEGREWEVACLAFYRGQEELIREGGDKGGYNKGGYKRGNKQSHVDGLQTVTENQRAVSNFVYNKYKTHGDYPVYIKLHSVDRFQGHEADVVFLSMSQTDRDGFLDNPNRLNVAITRAKFQLIIFGKHNYFLLGSRSKDLRDLAEAHKDAVYKKEK